MFVCTMWVYIIREQCCYMLLKCVNSCATGVHKACIVVLHVCFFDNLANIIIMYVLIIDLF